MEGKAPPKISCKVDVIYKQLEGKLSNPRGSRIPARFLDSKY
jgi:hypothetical protein